MRQLSKEIINDVALNMGIAPSYIEKDWYLVQILQVMSQLNKDGIKAVFAGGTCLSKAYDYTKRFSEDIDFCITGLSDASRKVRSQFKDNLIQAINEIDGLKVDMETVKSRDENKFVNFYVEYPKQFDLEVSLRNNLKIEISFREVYLPTSKKEIKTFVGNYLDDTPRADIDCVSYVETAANKFNALLWRTDIKDRTQPQNSIKNDPALMRHLYDLNILYEDLIKDNNFPRLVKEIYKEDCIRGDRTRSLSLKEFCDKTVKTLTEDEEYRKEYEMFVSKMVYSEQENISFDDALNGFKKLVVYAIKD